MCLNIRFNNYNVSGGPEGPKSEARLRKNGTRPGNVAEKGQKIGKPPVLLQTFRKYYKHSGFIR